MYEDMFIYLQKIIGNMLLDNTEKMEEAAYMLRAISNGTRLQVIATLSEMEEMSVYQLQEQLNCEQ